MGSSVARAARRSGLVNEIVGADMSGTVCARVEELGLASRCINDPAKAVEGSDIVIMAVPVGACGELARRIAPGLSADAILSDVGSVKKAVIETVSPHVPEGVHFIPAHPIAGAEHSGPDAGFAGMFDNRWSIITPPPGVEERALERLKALWAGMGSRVEIMTAEHHDLVLGITSHLPHLIAYTIVGTAVDLGKDLEAEVIQYSAGGFRDFTRIAASDPVMWRDVFLNNREAVLEMLQRFNEDLSALQKAIRRGEGDYLYRSFERTRDIRRKIIEAGQADYRSASGSGEETPPAEAPHAVSGG